MGKSGALRRATEMWTDRLISAAGGIRRPSDAVGNVDRFGGFQPMAKSSALRRATEMPTGRRIAAAGEIRRASDGGRMSTETVDFGRWGEINRDPDVGGNVDRSAGFQPMGK